MPKSKMMNNIKHLLLGNDNKQLSGFSDPFKKGSLKRIWIDVSESLFQKGVINYTASIEFKSGDTSGAQKITGNDFNDLISKVNTFINSL